MSFFTRFELRKANSYETIFAQDIIYVSADNKRVQLHLADQTETFNYLLRDLEGILKDCGLFYRIHRSYIVNFMYVRRYDSTGVEMENGDRLPLKTRGFKEKYQDYIFSQHR
jgi:DNA-binding LytR/AlgR family response regulator